MAFGSWIIETIVKFNNTSLISGLERSSAAMSAADIRMGQLTGKITAQEAAWLRMSNSVSKARQETNAMINSGAAIGFAAIAAGIGYAADQAARLQRTLIAIKNETGAGPGAMEGFYNTTFRIANQMGVAPGEAAQVMLDISRLTAGQLSTSQMQRIAPEIANAASAINFNRPDVSVKEATDSIIQLIHMNRAYTPGAMRPLEDKLYRLMGMMVESPQQAVRQMSYYEPLFKGSGVNTETEVAVMALLDRAGFRNKVGTGVAASLLEALGPLQLTKHFQEGQGRILSQMGIFRNGKFDVYDSKGNVNYVQMLRDVFNYSQLQERNGATQAEVERQIYGAFGKQGGRVMSLFADPTISAPITGALDQLTAFLKNPHTGISAAIKNRDDSVSFQFGRAIANLNAVMAELGYPWLTDLAHFFKGLGDNLATFRDWLHGHRDAEKVIGAVMMGLATFLGSVAVVGGVAQMLRFLGIIEELPNAFMATLIPLRLFATGLGLIPGPAAAATTSFTGLRLALAGAAAGAMVFSAILAMLALKGDSGGGPVTPDSNAPPGSPASLAAARARAIRNAIAPGRPGTGLGNTQMDRLFPSTAPVHVQVLPGAVQVHGVQDPKKIAALLPEAIRIAFSDPRSLINSSPQHSPVLPMPLTVKPA